MQSPCAPYVRDHRARWFPDSVWETLIYLKSCLRFKQNALMIALHKLCTANNLVAMLAILWHFIDCKLHTSIEDVYHRQRTTKKPFSVYLLWDGYIVMRMQSWVLTSVSFTEAKRDTSLARFSTFSQIHRYYKSWFIAKFVSKHGQKTGMTVLHIKHTITKIFYTET